MRKEEEKETPPKKKNQEMETTTPFDQDESHHHYDDSVARKILKQFQFAWDIEQQFIAPLRARKVYPGLFWGTFDVSCIVVYNQSEPFPDDSRTIERGAFDEHMVEFGFWLGDDHLEHPTFFILPYPFVEGEPLEMDGRFPQGSYFDSEMAEYLYPMESEFDEWHAPDVLAFFRAGFDKSHDYLKWKDTDHYFEKLRMKGNRRNRES